MSKDIGSIFRLITFLMIPYFLFSACNKQKTNTESNIPPGSDSNPVAYACNLIDVTDTLLLYDQERMSRHIVNIAMAMQQSDSIQTTEAITAFLTPLSCDEKGLKIVNDLFDNILNSPLSPARDEGKYILYLQSLLKVGGLPVEVSVRAEENLRVAQMNRPGSRAADFRYVDSRGYESSLYSFRSRQILLIFYDIDCPHCKEILPLLAANHALNVAISSGEISVLAIYTEGDRQLWESTKGEMPANWTVGYDLTGILETDLYDLPAMPTLYLLDSAHRVILKDPDPSLLLQP